jgi:hypothetical protein
MVDCFGGSCGICGYDKANEALEFHHVDPDGKDFAPAAKNKSWKKIKDELEKCVMLCSNCHREIHAGVTEIPADIQRFVDPEDQPVTLVDQCPVCGKYKKSDYGRMHH